MNNKWNISIVTKVQVYAKLFRICGENDAENDSSGPCMERKIWCGECFEKFFKANTRVEIVYTGFKMFWDLFAMQT